MRRINDGEIALTEDELKDISDFIRDSLKIAWNDHTNNYTGCSCTLNEGMKRMNPSMYYLTEVINSFTC